MSDAAFQDARLKGDFKSKGPELLVDLAEQCSVALRESAGLDNDKADQVGREIADRMVVAVSTVKTHINHLYGKLGVDSRTRALAEARRRGLIA